MSERGRRGAGAWIHGSLRGGAPAGAALVIGEDALLGDAVCRCLTVLGFRVRRSSWRNASRHCRRAEIAIAALAQSADLQIVAQIRRAGCETPFILLAALPEDVGPLPGSCLLLGMPFRLSALRAAIVDLREKGSSLQTARHHPP